MRNEEETKLDFLKGTSLHTIWQSRINNGYDTDASLRRVQWPNHKRQYIKDTASTPGFFLLLSDCGSIDRSNERMIFFSSHHQRHLSSVLLQSWRITRWLLTFFALPRLPHEIAQATVRTTTTKMLLLLFAEPKFGLFWYCNTVLVNDTGRATITVLWMIQRFFNGRLKSLFVASIRSISIMMVDSFASSIHLKYR